MSKAKRETRREKVARKLNWKTTLRDVKGKETEAALEHKGEEASVEEIRGERQTKRNKNAESFSGASGGPLLVSSMVMGSMNEMSRKDFLLASFLLIVNLTKIFLK